MRLIDSGIVYENVVYQSAITDLNSCVYKIISYGFIFLS